MVRLEVVLALASLPLAPGAVRGTVDPVAPADLRAVVQREAAAGFSGSVLVTRGAELLLEEGAGVLWGRAVGADTRFWIASAGKQFTSAAVLRCREKGLLALDATLGELLPGVPPDKRAITLRQLLTHTSGLAQSYVAEGLTDRATAVARLLAEPLAGPNGSAFRYSNANYELAVAVVESVSRRDYRDFVRDELWRPAGLRDTGFAGDDGASRVAPTRAPAPARLARVSWGGQGVYSTTADLARWIAGLRSGRVLTATSVDELFSGSTPIQEGRVGLGWFVGRSASGGERRFTRGNEDFGANSLVYWYPGRDVVIVVLTHGGDAPDGRSWSRRVHAALEQVLSL